MLGNSGMYFEITSGSKKSYNKRDKFDLSDNKNTTQQNLLDTANTVLRGKFIATNAYVYNEKLMN